MICKTISITLVNLLTWYSCLILMCLHRAGGDANHVLTADIWLSLLGNFDNTKNKNMCLRSHTGRGGGRR